MSWFHGGPSFSRRAHQLMLLEEEEDDLLVRIAIEEEEPAAQESVPRWGGSVPGRAVVHQGHLEGAARLYNDYFSNTPVYGHALFRRRFRMSRNLFVKIASAVEACDEWFKQKRDGAGRLGLSALQKMTAAIRQLAYGISADATDEYVRIGASTAIEALKRFVRAVVNIFKDEYLRAPTQADTDRLLAIHAFQIC